jgi:SAM-dependent methyltransferase
MKLTEEGTRSYIDDIKYVELIKFLTWKGDAAPTWVGKYMPATRSDDADLVDHARFNRDHYLFYRALIEKHMDKRGSALDLGCGTGQRTAMRSRYTTEGWGAANDLLTISAASHLNNISSEITFAYTDLWNQTKDDCFGRKFDYIFLVEVIEHIEIPKQVSFIQLAVDLLEPDGKMFITTPRDRKIERKAPHIGLWDDAIMSGITKHFDATVEYFSVKQLADGGENPWAKAEDATHYVMVIEK